ncbi:MAG: nuclear transport factor 2 family protein [Actinobacteria bacterium]|nr:nuclear transport factor 2 family protein [Actinomycetota bacterium]
MDDTTRYLLDRIEIQDLEYRYCSGLDRRDWDLLLSAFTPDAVVDYLDQGGVKSGPDELLDHLRGGLEGLDVNQHLISNITAEVKGDEADVVCYVHAPHLFEGEVFMIGGEYHDKVVRTGTGWLIRRKTLHATWTEGDSDVMFRGAAKLVDDGGELGRLGQMFLDCYGVDFSAERE